MRKNDWRKAQLAGKRVLSMLDEKDYRGKDAAARWLEKNDRKRKPSNHNPSNTGAA